MVRSVLEECNYDKQNYVCQVAFKLNTSFLTNNKGVRTYTREVINFYFNYTRIREGSMLTATITKETDRCKSRREKLMSMLNTISIELAKSQK